MKAELENVFDPSDPGIKHAADMVLEQAALNNLGVLGAEKQVTPDGKIRVRLPECEWIIVGRITSRDLD